MSKKKSEEPSASPAVKKRVVTYDYESVPTIRRFAHSNTRHRILIGPFGSGKSVGCVMEIIRRGHEQRPSPVDGMRKTRWAVIRNTYNQLRDTTMKTVFDWFPYPDYGTYRVADHEYIITGFDGVKIELLFRALDRPDQVANLLSLELTGAWVNEAREIPREIWDALDGRIGRFPSKRDGGASWIGTILDTNPPDEDNWIYKMAEQDRPETVEIYKQPGGRSPLAENIPNLPKNYYTELAIGKPENFIHVYIDGNYGFLTAGNPVYKTSYNDSLHCSKDILEPIKSLPLITGWDFYLMPSLVIGQITPRGQLRILDELIGENMGIERFLNQKVIPLLNTKYRGMGVMGYGDPTGNVRSQTDETTCYQVLKKNSFLWVRPAPTNSVMARIGAVEYYLTRLIDGEPGFLLSPNCIMLRKGFNGGYSYNLHDEIIKNLYSHPHDALEYLSLFLENKIRTYRPQHHSVVARKKYTPATPAGY